MRTNIASKMPPWGVSLRLGSSWMRDLPIILGGLALFYGLLSFARYGVGPINAGANIDLSPTALPKYALFSVVRLSAAYVISLGFTLVYGYVAAYNARAERYLIPLLDTLQSIPVLSFLPGVMLAMVALFPNRQLESNWGNPADLHRASLEYDVQFYASLKNIPVEMREAAQVYGLSWWQRFVQMELPYALIGLIWNSMMSWRWLVSPHGVRDVRVGEP